MPCDLGVLTEEVTLNDEQHFSKVKSLLALSH